MKMKSICVVLVLVLSVVAFGMIGCSGGGGGNPPPPPSDNNGGTGGTGDTGGTGGTTVGTSAAKPMVVTSKVTVVDAKLSGTVAAAKSLFLRALKLAPPAGTDYDKDKTEVFVHERSVEGFNIINEILCSMAQTKYDSMMNKGPYKALVDTNQCSSDRGDAAAAGQKSSNKSSGSDAPDYETWTVDVTRADGESPQYVKFWIHTEEGPEDKPVMIFGLLTITEGVSETNPYGLFTINFEEYPVTLSGAVDTNTSVLKGFLNAEKESSTGKILLKFAMEGDGPGWSMTQMVTLDRAADGASGGGTVAVSESFGGFSNSANFNVAFDQANFLRGDYPGNNNKVCLDRENFDETVWRYSLYDEAGARVIKNSGFPIKYNNGTRDYFGWVGYWDLWLPEEVTINDGATIYKQTYGPDGGTETAYTLLKRGGKLKKHDRKILTLADVKNIPLDYRDNNSGTNYQVAWRNGAFVYLAKQNQTNWTWDQCTAQTCPVSIGLTALEWDQLNFWSQSLGGSIQVKLNCPPEQGTMWPPKCTNTSASDSSKVILYLEDIVYPGDLGTQPLTLSCYDDMGCPDPAALATQNPFFTSQITIPAATITLDGATGDWTGITALATDSSSDGTGAKAGDDIKALYAAKDNGNLFLRMDLTEDANTSFGNGPAPNDGNYRFHLETEGGTYPYLEIGIVHRNGQWEVGGNGSSWNAPASLSDDGSGNGNPNLVGVSSKVIELKIPLADIGNPTVIRKISAEVNNCCGSNEYGAWDISEVIVKQDYTFDPTANGMVLKSGGADVVLTTASANPENQWGLNSAPLFNPTAANLALLACDWDPNRLCPWRAWSELPVYYTWETGPNSWNQLTLLKDGNNNALKFDPPLRIDYVHSQSDTNAPDYKYNGTKFFFEYAGFGELHGIPGKCVDMDTGQDISCGEGGPGTRWVPEFSIPTGATVADGTSATYYVKQLEKEQRMKGVDAAACSSSLSLTNYPLPSVGFGWQKPDIGQEPAITVAPAVIGGVVQ